ncbi:MAG: hypothetical protein WD712_00435 [Candidatus Spechtbacterales bacterium]
MKLFKPFNSLLAWKKSFAFFAFLLLTIYSLVLIFSANAQSPPSVEIISPQIGEVFEPEEEITLSIQVEDFVFVIFKSFSVPFPGNDNAGHAHVWVVREDVSSDSLEHDSSRAILGTTPIKLFAPTETGTYKIVVELTQNHHVPYDPPARDEVLIYVGEPFNTPRGTDVEVELDGAVITFSEITESGDTEIETSDSGTPAPSGFQLGDPPVYYNITTTAEYNGSIKICLPYNDENFITEDNLKLMHFKEGEWVDITISLDTENKIICGEANGLSEFALMTQNSIEELAGIIIGAELEQGIEQSLLKKLENALRTLEKGFQKPTANMLNSFVNEVEALAGKKVEQELADELANYAEGLIELLE